MYADEIADGEEIVDNLHIAAEKNQGEAVAGSEIANERARAFFGPPVIPEWPEVNVENPANIVRIIDANSLSNWLPPYVLQDVTSAIVREVKSAIAIHQ